MTDAQRAPTGADTTELVLTLNCPEAKTVGATAHYVSDELDEGPIIAQQVVEVDHTYGPEDLVAAGRDSECKALSNAVRWHCEGRVILSGHRTVVLR